MLGSGSSQMAVAILNLAVARLCFHFGATSEGTEACVFASLLQTRHVSCLPTICSANRVAYGNFLKRSGSAAFASRCLLSWVFVRFVCCFSCGLDLILALWKAVDSNLLEVSWRQTKKPENWYKLSLEAV
jgi:hypothetical protein